MNSGRAGEWKVIFPTGRAGTAKEKLIRAGPSLGLKNPVCADLYIDCIILKIISFPKFVLFLFFGIVVRNIFESKIR